MELKHAFVGVTRTRLLLLHLSPNHNEYGIDPLMKKLIKNDLAIEEDSDDLSRFSNVTLSNEEYERLAESYKDAEMYDAAAAVYRKIDKIPESIHCEFLAKDDDDIELAILGRDLAKSEHNLSDNVMKNIHKRSLSTCSNHKSKTKLKFELINYHARKLGLNNIALEAQAEQDELNATRYQKPILWAKAAKTFMQLKKYNRAGNAFTEANKFIEAARAYNLSKNHIKLRDLLVKHIENMSKVDYELITFILIPELINNNTRKVNFNDKIKKIFKIELLTEFYNLGASYEQYSNYRKKVTEKLQEEVEELKAQGDFEKIAQIEIKKGNYFKAWNLYYENGCLDEAIELFANQISEKDINKWIEENQNIGYYDWYKIMKSRFKLIDNQDPIASINFFDSYPLISKNRSKELPNDFKTIITSMKLIKYPIPIDEDICKQEIKKIVKEYQSEHISRNKENTVILFAIRYAILRVIQATESKYGTFENISFNDENHEILMLMTELIVKYKYNPMRCKDEKTYRKVKMLIFSIIEHLQKIDVIDILFDWILYCEKLQNYDKKRY